MIYRLPREIAALEEKERDCRASLAMTRVAV